MIISCTNGLSVKFSGSHIFVLVVSTLDQVRSTLDPVSSRSVCQTETAEMGQQVDTRSGQVDTLRLKVKIVNFSVHVAAWDLGDLT
ncbi:hypothetical protein Taro_000656, partial [Colocasia esculenta]|nr:hypothetical protein [Colocasia esculenta]